MSGGAKALAGRCWEKGLIGDTNPSVKRSRWLQGGWNEILYAPIPLVQEVQCTHLGVRSSPSLCTPLKGGVSFQGLSFQPGGEEKYEVRVMLNPHHPPQILTFRSTPQFIRIFKEPGCGGELAPLRGAYLQEIQVPSPH